MTAAGRCSTAKGTLTRRAGCLFYDSCAASLEAGYPVGRLAAPSSPLRHRTPCAAPLGAPHNRSDARCRPLQQAGPQVCWTLRFCCAFRSRGAGASASGTANSTKAQPGTLQHRVICLGGIQRRYMRLCRPEMMRRPKCCFCMLGLPRLTSMFWCVWGLDFLFPGISTQCAKDQKVNRAYSGPVQLRLCWLARLQYSTSGPVSFRCAPSWCRQLAFAGGSLTHVSASALCSCALLRFRNPIY